MLTRREAIGTAAAGTLLAGCGHKAKAQHAAAPLTTWEGVKEAFGLSGGDFAGFYLAAHPRPVREAIERHRRGLDAGARAYIEEHQQELEAAVTAAAAAHLGVPGDQIAFTGSTTEGLAHVYRGLKLGAGDEVVTTVHDFYATHVSLDAAAVRSGARVRRVRLYEDPAQADAATIVKAISRAVTPRTRAVAITWVHSSTGVKLPVAEIAKAVHARNPKTLVCVDGVHGFGAEADKPAQLGCDVLISGCHKWLAGPRGTGLIWATPDAWRQIEPLVPSFDGRPYVAWMDGDDPPTEPAGPVHTPGGFHAFEHRWALAQAFGFQQAIGARRIADRIHALAARLRDGLAQAPKVKLVTPPDLAAGLVCLDLQGMRARDAVAALARRRIVASVTPYAVEHVRLGAGIHLSERDVDAAVAAIRAL